MDYYQLEPKSTTHRKLSPSLIGMLSNMGASVQGERPAHRHLVLHRDLGRKGGLGKSKHLMVSVWFVNIWVQN